jgi:hypothetical protein
MKSRCLCVVLGVVDAFDSDAACCVFRAEMRL